VWLPGEGWRRVDPTAAVSPERIERGLEEAVAAEGSFLADSPLSPLRYRGVNWVNWLRLRYDALTYRWQSWVVGFDGEQQLEVLQRWLGDLEARKFVLVLLGSGVLVLVPVALSLLLQRRPPPRDPCDRLYLAFCERLAALGVARRAGEPPGAYADRVCQALPALAEPVRRITREYEHQAYRPPEDLARRRQALETMRGDLKALPRYVRF